MISKKIELDEIVKYVNYYFDIELRTNSRVAKFVDARSLYYKLSREFTNETLANIGKFIGKHHASVMHSLNTSIHYLKKKDIEEAYCYFGKAKDLPEDSYSYMAYRNKELTKEIERKNTILGLTPKLESFYNKYNELIDDRQVRVDKIIQMQMNIINNSMSNLIKIVEVETEKQYLHLNK